MCFYINKISKSIQDLQKIGDDLATKAESPSLKQKVREFLISWSNPWTLVYLCTPQLYICSFFGSPDWDNQPYEYLKNWNESCPGYHYIDEHLCLGNPFDRETPSIQKREPLIYLRYFEGINKEYYNFYELNQVFLQTANICFIPERKAYCNIDISGDCNDLIYVEESEGCDGLQFTEIF